MTGPVLDVHGVSVQLAGRPVLSHVDLQVEQGEFVALLGANGSGKSTLVRAVVGLVPVCAGRVQVFGTPLGSFRDWRRLGYVPQRLTATSGVPATVTEVVAEGRLSRSAPFRRTTRTDREAVRAALEAVGMADRARDSLGRLSGGQQQRVLIARALAGRPEVLILDEPTAGVDVPSQQAFADALETLAGHGTTVLLVAHELGPLRPLVQRAVVLRHGQVVHDGPPPAPVAGAHHVHAHGPSSDGEGLLS
jgi:zinc transport system ATP-binding protein